MQESLEQIARYEEVEHSTEISNPIYNYDSNSRLEEKLSEMDKELENIDLTLEQLDKPLRKKEPIEPTVLNTYYKTFKTIGKGLTKTLGLIPGLFYFPTYARRKNYRDFNIEKSIDYEDSVFIGFTSTTLGIVATLVPTVVISSLLNSPEYYMPLQAFWLIGAEVTTNTLSGIYEYVRYKSNKDNEDIEKDISAR